MTESYKATIQTINDILIKAFNGAGYQYLKKPWYLWLAAENFEEIQPLAKRPDGSDIMATEAPVTEYAFRHLGKGLETLAKELQDASDEAWINRVYFAVMGERTARDGSMMLCRIKKTVDIDTVRVWPKHSSWYTLPDGARRRMALRFSIDMVRAELWGSMLCCSSYPWAVRCECRSIPLQVMQANDSVS